MRRVEAFLEQHIGLATDSLGAGLVQRAARGRMNARGLADAAAYADLLARDLAEQQALIEAVVVPETWFFRNQAAFDYLAGYARHTWLAEAPARALRVLSLPCATGEEAYSLALTLLEAGLPPARFQIDALDISQRGIAAARAGLYPPTAFRCQKAREVQSRHFTRVEADAGVLFQISPHLRECVRFAPANLLDPHTLPGPPAYDIVFCRNLLIYLTPAARQRAVAQLSGLLRAGGLLFLGHAERAMACPQAVSTDVAGGFTPIRQSGVFACRKHPATVVSERRAPVVRPLPARLPAQPADIPAPLPARRQAEAVDEPLEHVRRLADQGALQQARELCLNVLERRADHVQAHFLCGLIHQALGEAAQAEVFFNRAVYLDPRHAEALRYLLLIADQRGDETGAARLRGRLQRLREKQEAEG